MFNRSVGIRERLGRLERRLRPAGLAQEWYALLAGVNERWGLGWSEAELWEEARRSAATGRAPGEELARVLEEEAEHRQGVEARRGGGPVR